MIDKTEFIERWLLAHSGWTSAREICDTFNLDERELRASEGKGGLLSVFAISGSNGYRHVRRATPQEWCRFKWGQRRHAISELRRVAALDKRRQRGITQSLFGEDDSLFKNSQK